MTNVLPSETACVQSQVKTKFVKHSYNFCWSVEDYPKYPATFFVTSPKFHPAKELTFYATLRARSSGYSNNLLDFEFVQVTEEHVEVNHLISITDSKGNELWSGSKTCNFQNVYNNFILAETTDFIVQTLIYKCRMEFYLSSTDIVNKHPLPSPMQMSPNLVDDLRNMYSNPNYTDLCLKLEKITLNVHKGILSARSPVFAKMLESPMEEKEKNIILIEDLELPVVEGLLEFIYTGILCKDDFDFVHDLYYAADKYDVSSLIQACTDVLLAKMEVDNACRVLCLANRHADVPFKEAAMAFVQFHFDDIVETSSWAELLEEETKLAAEVMRKRSQKSKKEIVSN